MDNKLSQCGVCCKHQQRGRQLPTAIAGEGVGGGWLGFFSVPLDIVPLRIQFQQSV